MTGSLWLPIDDVSGASIDFDRAADFLELSAFFATDSTALASDLVNQYGIGAKRITPTWTKGGRVGRTIS